MNDRKEALYLLSKNNLDIIVNITKALGKVNGKQDILDLRFKDHDNDLKMSLKEIIDCVRISVDELKELSLRLEASPFFDIIKEIQDFKEKAMEKFGAGQGNALRGLSSILIKIKNIEKMMQKRDEISKETIKHKWTFRTVLVQSITAIISASIAGAATYFATMGL